MLKVLRVIGSYFMSRTESFYDFMLSGTEEASTARFECFVGTILVGIALIVSIGITAQLNSDKFDGASLNGKAKMIYQKLLEIEQKLETKEP